MSAAAHGLFGGLQSAADVRVLEAQIRHCEAELHSLPQQIRKAEEAHQAVLVRVALLREKQKERRQQSRMAKRALNAATGKAKAMCLTTWVKFRDDKRPCVWRDISNHVKFEWAVAVGDRASGSEPEVLSLKDCRRIALEGQRPTQNKSPSIITWEGRVVSLTVKEAEAILKTSRESAAPPALGSFALLKAGLGAMRNVLLEKKVQSFFDDPETGLIRVKDVPIPEKLSTVLRPYQATGYHWLVNNARNGLGCILADDMGLGKTVQAIALMLFLKQSHMLSRPMLVIVPTGLLSNWSRELKKWAADDLTFQVFHGNSKNLLANARPKEAPNWICPRCEEPNSAGRAACNNCGAPKPLGALGAAAAAGAGAARAAAAPKAAGKGKRGRALTQEQSANIMLTSYGTFRTSAQHLMKAQTFAGIILDEAQNIKNHGTQVARLVKQMADCCGTVRVALSGTPVENSLADLHSCFEFILPGYLANSKSEFTKEFAKPLAAAARKQDPVPEVADKQRLLQRLIQPFVMRRLKSDKNIAADLPDKVEQNHDCELSPVQETFYKSLQEKGQRDAEGAQGIERRGQVLAMLHALRKVCNHPACLDPEKYPQGTEQIPKSSDIEASGKCAKLHELLQSIIAAEEKVLIFSTYLATISLLKGQIEENFNSKVKTIVGEMAADQRQEAVDAFQNDPAVSVLILSLQAGGVGLNLTAATHVIHFDRCYNPAKEAQATDRAHRIGQTRTVFVHRLITKGTFEERLHDIMVAKQKLSDLTITGGEGWIADLNNDELRELFELSGERTDGPAVKRRKRAEAQDHDGRAGRAGMNAMDVDGVFHQVPR